LSLGGVWREGRCCDHGNFPRTPKSIFLTETREGQVWIGADVRTAWEETGSFLWFVQQS